MTIFRRVFTLVLVGALAGEFVGTLVARSFIPWYNTPGDSSGTTQQLCNLHVQVRSTIDELVRAQLIGGAAGALVFLIVGGLLMRALARRGTEGATPKTP